MKGTNVITIYFIKIWLPRFPNRSATLCGDSQAVKTMKNTAEVCHAAGGAKPPKSWLLHKG